MNMNINMTAEAIIISDSITSEESLNQINWGVTFPVIIVALILLAILILTIRRSPSKNNTGSSYVNDLSPEEIQQIKDIYRKQKKGGSWNFYQEREYIENLFCQRINFLILSFSLFVTAFASLDDRITQIVILVVGFIITLPLSILTVRAYRKLDINLKIIFNLDDDYNTMKKVNELMDKYQKPPKIDEKIMKNRFGSYNRLIGVILPKLICLLYLFGAGTLIILLCLGVVQ